MKTYPWIPLATAAFAVVVVGLVLSHAIVLADVPPAPEIGAKVADFKLKNYDGKDVSLADNSGKIVVLMFTSTECPVSRGHEAAMAATAEKYKDKGVVFVSVDSNRDTTPDQIKEYASGKNSTGKLLPYPIVKDVGNKYADAMGAVRTPEIYIVGKDGKLAYHGAVDNDKKMDDPAYENYVGKALGELVAGKPVSLATKSAYGCGIRRAG